MRFKEKEYSLDFNIFNYRVRIVITNDIIKSRNLRDNIIGHKFSGEAGALHCYNDTGNSWIFLPYEKSVDYIVHESFHCIRRMFEYCSVGMENETWAYHLGYLSNAIYKLYK